MQSHNQLTGPPSTSRQASKRSKGKPDLPRTNNQNSCPSRNGMVYLPSVPSVAIHISCASPSICPIRSGIRSQWPHRQKKPWRWSSELSKIPSHSFLILGIQRDTLCREQRGKSRVLLIAQREHLLDEQGKRARIGGGLGDGAETPGYEIRYLRLRLIERCVSSLKPRLLVWWPVTAILDARH